MIVANLLNKIAVFWLCFNRWRRERRRAKSSGSKTKVKIKQCYNWQSNIELRTSTDLYF